jgi:hypothetical protein
MGKPKTFTAPMAIIQVKDPTGTFVTIGKMRSVRLTENINRGRVIGLGNLTAEEIPAVGYNCGLSCSAYTVDFKKALIAGSIDRAFSNPQDFVDKVLLQEDGVSVQILRRQRNADGTVSTPVFLTINDLFMNSDSMDISEGQISGRDASFEYLTPVLGQ